MGGLRAPEIILIILAIVLLFGASRLPQLAKSIGASRKAFKDGLAEGEAESTSTTSRASLNAPSDDELAAELARRRATAQVSK